MELLDRRRLLISLSNPDMSIDYLVSISGTIETQNFTEEMTRLSGTADYLSSIEVAVHYVPDRLILDDGSINEYFNYYQEHMPKQIEELGINLLGDFNNELVPRWIKLFLTVQNTKKEKIKELSFFDSQPNFENYNLLSSIRDRT
tara:strand:- start:322 stop:756 length:435 start_codon:yes stop_codon:yes gene_type:complete